MRTRCGIAVFCFIVALGLPLRLAAKPVAYHLRSWDQSSGLPNDSLQAIVRDQKGYLWMTSDSGLLRFDGVRFQMFNPSNTPALRSNNYSFGVLLQSRDGSLWAGTRDAGVVRYQGGEFTAMGEEEGLPGNDILRIDQDDYGDVWIYTRGGLARWRNGQMVTMAPRPGSPFNAFLTSSKKQVGFDGFRLGLWRSIAGRLERFAYGRWAEFPLPEGVTPDQLHIRSVHEDSKRRIWYSLHERRGDYFLVDNGRLQTLHGLPQDSFVSWEDRNGGLWITDHHGRSAIWKDGESSPMPALATPEFFSVMEDPSGTLWIATVTNGLFRGQIAAFTVISQSGAPEVAASLLMDRNRRLWIASDTLQQMQASLLVEKAHLWDRTNLSAITSLMQRANGEIIAGTREGIYRLTRDVLQPVIEPSAGLNNTIQSWQDGALWAGGASGLARIERNQLERFPSLDNDTAPVDVSSMVREPWGFWTGTNKGLTRLELTSGRTWKLFPGWTYGAVRCLYQDSQGSLWVGTESQGLLRMKDGNIRQFSKTNGLPDNLVSSIVEDRMSDTRSLWVQTGGGLAGIELSRLDETASELNGISWSLVDREDGMPSRLFAPAGQARSLQDLKGNLLFTTPSGIVVLRPDLVSMDEKPPRVYIEGYEIDGVSGGEESSITISPGHTVLNVHYTAITPGQPERVRFLSRIKGLDAEWTDVGTQRNGIFARIPAGEYEFEVKSLNAFGIPSSNVARIPIHVLPHFYQRRLVRIVFILFCLAVIVLLLLYVQTRSRHESQIQRAFAHRLMASQESERKRIAADLHDGLGQHLVLINNLSLLGKSGDLPRIRQELFSQIEEQTGQALRELRSISYDLRPYQLDRMGLTHAIEALVSVVDASFAGAISADLENIDGLIPTHLEIALYRIAQESLNNLVKHSHATMASIRISVEAATVIMIVADNGCGVHLKSGSTGFGLIGMQERATILQGMLAVGTGARGGTTITLSVPIKMD